MSGGVDRDAVVTGLDYEAVVVGGGPAGCSAAVFLARGDRRRHVQPWSVVDRALCASGELPRLPRRDRRRDVIRSDAPTTSSARVASSSATLVESVESRATDDTEEARFRHPAGGRAGRHPLRGSGDPIRRGVPPWARRRRGDVRDPRPRRRDSRALRSGVRRSRRNDADRRALRRLSPPRPTDRRSAAGRGARVARRVVTDARIDDGWWPAAAEDVDWVRREAEREEGGRTAIGGSSGSTSATPTPRSIRSRSGSRAFARPLSTRRWRRTSTPTRPRNKRPRVGARARRSPRPARRRRRTRRRGPARRNG